MYCKPPKLAESPGFTEWPVDFIPQTHIPKIHPDKDPTPIESRMQFIHSLDRRLPEERENTDFPTMNIEDFGKRLSSLRDATYSWGGQRVKEIFVEKMLAKFYGEEELLLGGRKMRNHHDFCTIIKNGPWNDKMRAMVHYAQDGMWETNNRWSIQLEAEYAAMLGIKWSEKHSNVNYQEERSTEGNCAHHLFVKNKTSLVTRFRNTTKRAWLEAIYAREPAKNETVKPSKIPRVIDHIKTTNALSGFVGWIGYCEGHQKFKMPKTVYVYTDSDASSLSTNDTPDKRLFPTQRRRVNDVEETSASQDLSIDTSGGGVDSSRDDELQNLKEQLALVRAENERLEKQAENERLEKQGELSFFFCQHRI